MEKPEEKKERELPPIRSYTFKQLTVILGVPARTLRRWLKLIESETGPRIGHFYTPRQVRIIFERLALSIAWLFNLLFGSLLGDPSGSGEGEGLDKDEGKLK